MHKHNKLDEIALKDLICNKTSLSDSDNKIKTNYISSRIQYN